MHVASAAHTALAALSNAVVRFTAGLKSIVVGLVPGPPIVELLVLTVRPFWIEQVPGTVVRK
ncbi:MAG: hypothetical protein U1E35_08540 [Rhodospirillales bacterium]